MPGLYFTINEDPALEWLDEANKDISELLGGYHSSTDERVSSVVAAERLLLAILEKGPVAKSDIDKKAKLDDISARTLIRAKENLGILSSPVHADGNKGVSWWVWSLPSV